MTLVFVDTLYWTAWVVPGDPWRNPSLVAESQLPDDTHLITTEEVLTEFLSAMSKAGGFWREKASSLVRELLNGSNISVRPQSHESFLEGLDLYERRADKGYSLVACISIQTMRALKI
jgi:predicted nucleic acid-binding protein